MLKVILIGYGYWGSKLARNFQNLEIFKLVSIVDTNRKNIHLAKKKLSIG
jgi:predicted dehydrogenase